MSERRAPPHPKGRGDEEQWRRDCHLSEEEGQHDTAGKEQVCTSPGVQKAPGTCTTGGLCRTQGQLLRQRRVGRDSEFGGRKASEAPTLTGADEKNSPGPLGFVFYFLKFFNVSLFLRETRTRETQSAGRGGTERERDTESKQAPGSQLSAQSPTQGSNPRTLRS